MISILTKIMFPNYVLICVLDVNGMKFVVEKPTPVDTRHINVAKLCF